MRSVPVAIAAGAALVAAAAAAAGTAPTTLPVTATVAATCRVSAAGLAFGTYMPTTGPLTGTTRVNVVCSRRTAFRVALGLGTTPGASVARRLLANGAGRLQYNLYTTRAHTAVWADGTAGSRVRTGRGRGPTRPVSLIVYGMLPDNAANQAAGPGIYSDTIMVTVTY